MLSCCFLDSACKLPNMDIDDPELRSFFMRQSPHECDQIEPNWVTVENNIIKFRTDSSKHHPKMSCQYIGYSRGKDDEQLPVSHEHIKIKDNYTVTNER